MGDTKTTFSDPPDDMRAFSKRDFLAAWDLEGKDKTIKIVRLQTAHVPGNAQVREGGKLGALFFCGPSGKEHAKPIKLNSTNTAMITKLHGVSGKGGKNWLGKLITIYPTKTRMAGEEVDCIRVRPNLAKVADTTDIREDVPVDEAMAKAQQDAADKLASQA